MPGQTRIHRPTDRTQDDAAEFPVADRETPEERAARDAATEAVLDEIDDLLDEVGLSTETDAQEFVASYMQKGGE